MDSVGKVHIMSHPDFEGAKQYALDRLAREVSPKAHYHSLRHTRDDVLGAAERLAAFEGIEGEERLCLLTAAVFHDLGYLVDPSDHERASARIAQEVLPRYGYTPDQIACITGLILATAFPPQPRTLLECLIADADMDSLGREDFLTTSDALREERAEAGDVVSDEEWYAGQLEFLTRHAYFSRAARALREDGKRRNVERVRALLAAHRNGHNQG